MSDFEDEEGVDEPVLDDENEEEGTEEEEVSYFKIFTFISNVNLISTLLECRQINTTQMPCCVQNKIFEILSSTCFGALFINISSGFRNLQRILSRRKC